MYERSFVYYNSTEKLGWQGNFLKSPGPDAGNAWDARDFIDTVITVVGTGIIKIYGSAQKLPPDFSQPSTLENSYVPIVLADYSLVNTYYAGATGVTVSNTTKLVELNTNLLTWIAIQKNNVETVEVLLTECTNQ